MAFRVGGRSPYATPGHLVALTQPQAQRTVQEGGAPMRHCATAFSVILTLSIPAAGQGIDLTFFGWSDQHIQANGDWAHCQPAIEAMLELAGTPYPESIGGVVAEPAFIISAGDTTEWPTHAAVESYREMTALLPWPTYELAGNHDDGGAVPSETFLNYVREKHGSLDYAFDAGGVHFSCLFTSLERGTDNPAGPVFPEQLAHLRADLAGQSASTPVVVAMHHCSDSLTNMPEVLEAMAGRRVILVLGGHYHKPVLTVHGGIPFHQLPSPKSDIPAVTVFRVTDERLVGVTWDYANSAWLDTPVLDVPLQTPAPGEAGASEEDAGPEGAAQS